MVTIDCRKSATGKYTILLIHLIQTLLSTTGNQIFCFSLQAIFVLFAFLSAFQSFCQAKYDVLWFLFKGGLNQFVKFSFHVTCLVSSTYCSYCLCREWDAMKKMTDAMISYQTTWASATKNPAICVVLATITALLASLRSLLIINIKDFSVENAMLESS